MATLAQIRETLKKEYDRVENEMRGLPEDLIFSTAVCEGMQTVLANQPRDAVDTKELYKWAEVAEWGWQNAVREIYVAGKERK